jgi:EamA-like transporter family
MLTPTASPAAHTLSPVLPLIAAAACWGVGTVVTKQVLDDVNALTLLPLQLAASCLFLLAITLVRHDRATWSPQMMRQSGLGVLNPGFAYALGLLGLTTITASLSVLRCCGRQNPSSSCYSPPPCSRKTSPPPSRPRSVSPFSASFSSCTSPAQAATPAESRSHSSPSGPAPSTPCSPAGCCSTTRP